MERLGRVEYKRRYPSPLFIQNTGLTAHAATERTAIEHLLVK